MLAFYIAMRVLLSLRRLNCIRVRRASPTAIGAWQPHRPPLSALSLSTGPRRVA